MVEKYGMIPQIPVTSSNYMSYDFNIDSNLQKSNQLFSQDKTAVSPVVAVSPVAALSGPAAQGSATLLPPMNHSLDHQYYHHNHYRPPDQLWDEEQEQTHTQLAENLHPLPTVTIHHYPAESIDHHKIINNNVSTAVAVNSQPFQTCSSPHRLQQQQPQQQSPIDHAGQRGDSTQHLLYRPKLPTYQEAINRHNQPTQHWYSQRQENHQQPGHGAYGSPCSSAVPIVPSVCQRQSSATAVTAQLSPSALFSLEMPSDPDLDLELNLQAHDAFLIFDEIDTNSKEPNNLNPI